MGKNLKGREIGKGICQRKNGLYCVRYVDRCGKRIEKSFSTLAAARNWLADMQKQQMEIQQQPLPTSMTVDAWFDYWISNLVSDLSPNTLRNYRERYFRNVQPIIGSMLLTDVKPMHCKTVLNAMEQTYAGSTIRQAYITMGALLKAAVMNDLLDKHPMNGVRFSKPVRAVDNIRYLTREQQAQFLAVAWRSHNYRQYALILETGLRTGELIGLTWDNLDWEKRTLTVSKTLEYRYQQRSWRAPSAPMNYCGMKKPCESSASNRSFCPSSWNTWIVAPAQWFLCRCPIWFLSTIEPGSRPKIVPMTHISISCAKKQTFRISVCMLCATLMQLVP